jgi:hypothetical protein
MLSTTHLRCTDAVIAALLAHPNYQSIKDIIVEAKECVLGHRGKWAYAYHLPKRKAKNALMECLPTIIKKQLSSGFWKKKYAEVYTYGILRALEHAELLEQEQFRYNLFQGFQKRADLISILVRKNLMKENINVENISAKLFSNQQKNGSWFNSISATCFQLLILNELGINSSHELISLAIKWLFNHYYEAFEGKAKTWAFDFENIFLNDNYTAEQNGFQQVAPEHGRNPCLGSLLSGADSFIIQNPAMTTAIALYALTRLGHGNDKRIVNAYKSLYNIRGIEGINGEIVDKLTWCTGLYRPKSVRYDLTRTGVNFDDYLQTVKERKTK